MRHTSSRSLGEIGRVDDHGDDLLLIEDVLCSPRSLGCPGSRFEVRLLEDCGCGFYGLPGLRYQTLYVFHPTFSYQAFATTALFCSHICPISLLQYGSASTRDTVLDP